MNELIVNTFESLVLHRQENKNTSKRNSGGVVLYNMSLVMRKPDFCICENKDADQLRGYREADQRLCFHHMDNAIPLLSSKSEISSI